MKREQLRRDQYKDDYKLEIEKESGTVTMDVVIDYDASDSTEGWAFKINRVLMWSKDADKFIKVSEDVWGDLRDHIESKMLIEAHKRKEVYRTLMEERGDMS